MAPTAEAQTPDVESSFRRRGEHRFCI